MKSLSITTEQSRFINKQNWAEAEVMLWTASRLLIITHYAPDGDALGSLLGFTHAMRLLGKTVTPTCQDVHDPRFGYLPGIEEITHAANSNDFDLIVSLDADNLSRLGSIFVPSIHEGIPILVIDHHRSNTRFGSANIIEPDMSSTCEILLKLLETMTVSVNAEIATCLLTGIVTDTLNFRNSNTKPETLNAAADLMHFGASLEYVVRESLTRAPLDWLRILGVGIGLAKTEGRIAYSSIPFQLRTELSLPDEGDGGLVGTLLSIMGVEIVAVFEEHRNGNIHVSFRSTPGFDVSQVAVAFGGGGHKAAAGCLLPGPMQEVMDKVLPMLRDLVLNP